LALNCRGIGALFGVLHVFSKHKVLDKLNCFSELFLFIEGVLVEKNLQNYLEDLLGSPPLIHRLSSADYEQVPVYLQERYQFYSADFLGRKCFLAREISGPSPSPIKYKEHAEILRRRLGGDVILWLHDLPAYVRNRLVHKRVPFIVPGRQMFLPMLMIDLRERFAQSNQEPREGLSTVPQLVMLFYLVRGEFSRTPLERIADRLHYSAMAMSLAKDELEKAGLCEPRRMGRAWTLHFPDNKRDLWRRAEPLLHSPVRRTIWIRWRGPTKQTIVAGITALSRRTMISDDRVPTYAIYDRVFREAIDRGEVHRIEGAEEADARLERWKYDPTLLATDGVADPCSVYLSLREHADERVQNEIPKLIDALQW